MIEYFRQVKGVDLFLLAVNAQDSKISPALHGILEILARSFGAKIWGHIGVAYTKWGDQNKRRKLHMTEESKR